MVLTMVLTMLPTTAFAAGELPDVKLSVPTTFDKTVDLTKQNKELKIKDSKTYLIKGSADPNWYFQYRIKIDGKNNTPHIFLDGVRLQAPKDGPAIELYGGASASVSYTHLLSILKLEQKRKKESNYDAYSFTQRRSC